MATQKTELQLRGLPLIREFKRRHGDKTLLAFSRGKDAIATALAIRDHIEIIPIHYSICPDLEFIEESLAYYEKHLFHRKIIRAPHPAAMKQIVSDYLFQTVGNAEVCAAADLALYDHDDVRDAVVEQENLPDEIFTAIGVRADDSPMRRTAMKKYGPLRPKQRTWFPVHDWSKARLIAEIQKANISLPIDYMLWGRSFDGVDARFSIPMKKYLPNDYKKLLTFFPLMEAEMLRYEMHTGEKVNGPAHAPRQKTVIAKKGAGSPRPHRKV